MVMDITVSEVYSQLTNTRAGPNKSACMGDFGKLIIVPGEIRIVPVRVELGFWVPFAQFGGFFWKKSLFYNQTQANLLFTGLLHKILFLIY